MIVDAHVHVFLPRSEDPERTVDAIAPAEREARVESLVGHLDAAGVDGAVLVPLGPERGYVAEVAGARPDRFRAVAVAPPSLTDPTAGESPDPAGLVEDLAADGFRGLRLFALEGRLEDRPPWLEALERLAASGRVLWMYPRPGDLPTLTELVGRLPELQVVLNHSGFTRNEIAVDARGRPRIPGPVPQPQLEQVLALADFPNVAVMVSGAYAFSAEPYPYPDVAAVTRQLAERFGPDRLVWASDFPWIVDDPGYRACLELVEHHLPNLSPDERAGLLGDTIRRILDWGET